jgi:hypothetical protein
LAEASLSLIAFKISIALGSIAGFGATTGGMEVAGGADCCANAKETTAASNSATAGGKVLEILMPNLQLDYFLSKMPA